jgi:hypothetical protein
MSLFIYFQDTSTSYKRVPARMGDVPFKDVFYRVVRQDEYDHEETYSLEFPLSHIPLKDYIKVDVPCKWGTMPVYVQSFTSIFGNKVEITEEEIERLKTLSYHFKLS